MILVCRQSTGEGNYTLEHKTDLTAMEYTASPKPQLSSRANAFSIAALMSSGKTKDKETEENTIKPLGKLKNSLKVI